MRNVQKELLDQELELLFADRVLRALSPTRPDLSLVGTVQEGHSTTVFAQTLCLIVNHVQKEPSAVPEHVLVIFAQKANTKISLVLVTVWIAHLGRFQTCVGSQREVSARNVRRVLRVEGVIDFAMHAVRAVIKTARERIHASHAQKEPSELLKV